MTKSLSMEDIICPECGRPNLFEAEKCWFCQTSLKEIKNSEVERHSMSSTNTNEKNNKEKDNSALVEESEQAIPEWLKRVRDLKEADQPPEEDVPSWEQRDLFNLENDVHKNKKLVDKKQKAQAPTTSKDNKIEKKNDNPAEISEKKPNVIQEKNKADIQEIFAAGQADQDDDALSHDLPEGFKKL